MDRLHQLCAIIAVTICISCPTFAQAENHDQPWGGGAAGYGRWFAISMADNSIGSFFTTAIAPALFHLIKDFCPCKYDVSGHVV
jgi:hypothetical protein